MTFGAKLRELREAASMTREALAEASGVPFGSIHGYEIGRRSPSLTAAVKLAGALGVSVDTFAACEDVAVEKPAPKAAAKKPKK